MVYHANYVRYLERGRSDFLRLAGVGHAELLEREDPTAFVVARLSIDFKRPARIDAYTNTFPGGVLRFSAPFNGFVFDKQYLDAPVESADPQLHTLIRKHADALLAAYREWLQVLQWQNPARAGRPWVLKSPHHLTAADTVLDEFAGCKIVMTHRSPLNAVPSYASMVRAMSSQYSENVDPIHIGRYWSRRFAHTLQAFATAREARPDRFVDVRFADTVSKPLDVARQVLDSLGLPAGPADEAAFESYLEQNRTERHGSHSYTPEDFGLSEDQLRRDFAFYSEVYL